MSHTPHTHGSGQRILWVDADAGMAGLGQAMVTHLGYAVTLATSSPQALRLFQAAPHRFDLLITDREMPGLTGLELAAACRQTRPDLPILLCTGSPRPMEATRGMDAVLMKPFNLETLGTTIAQVLARRASRDA